MIIDDWLFLLNYDDTLIMLRHDNLYIMKRLYCCGIDFVNYKNDIPIKYFCFNGVNGLHDYVSRQIKCYKYYFLYDISVSKDVHFFIIVLRVCQSISAFNIASMALKH